MKGSEPLVDVARLRGELAFVLADLIRGYNRVIALTRRWPGALPLDITLQTLEKRLATAGTLQDDIIRRRGSVIPGSDMGRGSRINRGRGINR